MTYETAMALLEEKSKQGATPGLTRIRWLMKQLGNPQEQLQVIHVAGTNGKGSTVTMISQGLMACGCRVGKFTSPFIRRFTERITVDGEEISPEEVAALAEEVLALLPQMEQELGQRPTQFELVTAMAFCHFARKHCDYCVIEVGLGGLWDATNVISQPILSVITSISLDHTALLGSSLADIARHKGGIIKEGRPVVCYPCWSKEVEEVILAQARQMHAPVVRTSPEEIEDITLQGTGTSFVWRGKKVQLRLLGRHQCWNFCCAAAALTQLEGQDERIRQELWLPGVEGTSFVGRFQPVWDAPMVFLDGGHNREGVEATAAMLDSLPKEKRRIIVMGMMKDKDVEYCVSVMARRADVFVAVGSDYPRAMDAAGVAHLAEPYYPNVVKASTPSQGMALAWEMAKEDDILLGCGSLYFLGEMERKIQKLTNKVENRQN